MIVNKIIGFIVLLMFAIASVGCTVKVIVEKPTETSIDINSPDVTRLPSDTISTKTSIKGTETPLTAFSIEPNQTVTTTPFKRISPGTIYVIEQQVYGKLLPIDDNHQSVQQITPSDNEIPAPSFSERVGLSSYSGQIAYITKERVNSQNNDELLRLRIGDLALQKVDIVWTDWDEDLLYYEPENGDNFDIRWGPGDKSVIVRNRSNYVISSLTNKNDMTFKGTCEELIWMSEIKQWTLACNGDGEPGVKVIIMMDGTVQAKVLLPDSIEIKIKDWAFSPDSQSVLYATPSGQLFVAKPDGSTQPLPVLYQKPYGDISMRVLQWSMDGKKVLIWGRDPTQNYCPLDSTCWMVLDISTKRIIWHPQGEALNASSDATLSPDSKWIVLFIMNIPERYGTVISLETNQMYKISNWLSEEVRWVK